MPHHYTTRELAELLGTDAWRIRRLFTTGDLPEPPRFSGRRAIPREMIADVAAALRDRGWAPTMTPAAAVRSDSQGGAA